jgi:hypothetical protein
MQLHGRKTGELDGIAHLLDRLIDEDADFLDSRRNLFYDRLRRFGRDVARTLRIKHEADCVRSRIDGGERVVEVRDSANLDPGHKAVTSY